MDLDDVDWLTSPAGRSARTHAADLAALPLHRRHRALAREFGADAARRLLEQQDLAVRAVAKVPEPSRWLFEREALEQASPWAVAVERATRWPGAPDAPLVDIGAGIGVDALAAAVGGRAVVAYERDAVRAALLVANAVSLGVADLVLVRAEEAPADPPHRLVYVDPDRRAGGTRQREAEAFEPPPERWRAWANDGRAVLVKVGPSTRWPAEEGATPPFEVVSLNARAKERRLFVGAFPPRPPRRALALPSGRFVEGTGDEPLPPERALEPGLWLLDPDAAVRHADLVAALAQRFSLASPSPRRADYLVGTTPHADAPGAWLRIDAVLPPDPKRINRWFADAHIGRVEIRKRGVDDRAERWRRLLRLAGPEAGHLLLLEAADGREVACVGRAAPARD